MTDLREELRRAARQVSPPDEGLDAMFRRREAKRRAHRIGTAVLALGLVAAVAGGSLYALLRSGPGERQRFGEGGDLSMAPGDYLYQRLLFRAPETRSDGGSVSEEVDAEIETWWALDDSGRVRVGREQAYGLPDEGTYGAGEFPLEHQGLTSLEDLSTDPAALKRQLIDRSDQTGASPQPEITPGAGQDGETGPLVRAITYLVTWPNATPELRVALFEVFTTLPTVERDDDATDPVGRPAVSLRIVTEGTKHTLFFDPATRLWMASVEEHGSDEGPRYTLVERTGFVGSTEATPADDELFFPPPARPLPRA